MHGPGERRLAVLRLVRPGVRARSPLAFPFPLSPFHFSLFTMCDQTDRSLNDQTPHANISIPGHELIPVLSRSHTENGFF